jgi:NAD-dependent SIR2 family protein deacetylase
MANKPKFNADLVEDVAKRKVVLFIGAGVSRWAIPRAGGSFKSWAEFLTHACTSVSDPKTKKLIQTCIKKGDFLIASELLKNSFGDRWRTILSAEFQQAADISRLHAALVALDQRIIITTNFDKLIENAWADTARDRYPSVISKVDQKAFRLFRDDDPYLIKLHGTIDEPDSIVFDKTSYQRVAFANQFYRELIGTLLLTHTFVFVGFSMDDPAISLVVESHAYSYSETRPHYIFTPGPTKLPIDELSKSLRKLFVLRYSERNNHLALAESIEELGQEAQMRRRLSAAAVIS